MDFGDIVRAALEETIPGLLPALIAEEIREANADGRDGATDARRAGNVADVPAPRDARFETAEEWKRNVKKKKTRRGRGHAARRQREMNEARRAKDKERRRLAARQATVSQHARDPLVIHTSSGFDFKMQDCPAERAENRVPNEQAGCEHDFERSTGEQQDFSDDSDDVVLLYGAANSPAHRYKFEDHEEQQARSELAGLQEQAEITRDEIAGEKRYLAVIRAEIKEQQRLRDDVYRSQVLQEHRAIVDDIVKKTGAASKQRADLHRELRSLQKQIDLIDTAELEADMLRQSERRAVAAIQGTDKRLPSGEDIGDIVSKVIEGADGFEVRFCDGLRLYNYSKPAQSSFELLDPLSYYEVTEVFVKRECRGLVIGPAGVVARPLMKFFSEGQVKDTKMRWIADLTVSEATEKLDGAMVYGVNRNGVMQLWTRSGFTDLAEVVNRWAHRQGSSGAADVFGLLAAVEGRGGTAIFEWVGPQARVKVKEQETNLILTQVRDKVSGALWSYSERSGLAAHYRVLCVQRMPEYEGLSYKEVHKRVKEVQEPVEGFVLVLENEQMVKVKTKWWLGTTPHRYKRWLDVAQRRSEEARREKKERKMDIQELRAVVKGLPADESPAKLLSITGARRVEAFFTRKGGKRGAVIFSFSTVAEKAIAMMRMSDMHVEMLDAYSCRSNSNSWHKVRTWYA